MENNKPVTRPSVRPSPKPKSVNRGTKVLITSLSIAVTVGGWAWLSNTQSVVADESLPTPTEIPTVQLVQRTAKPRPSLPTALPGLDSLPVRGLHEVGDPVFEPPPQREPAARERGGGGGGNQVAAQVAPPSAPKPRPDPVRKTKSSK